MRRKRLPYPSTGSSLRSTTTSGRLLFDDPSEPPAAVRIEDDGHSVHLRRGADKIVGPDLLEPAHEQRRNVVEPICSTRSASATTTG